jgi:hypothetical protein
MLLNSPEGVHWRPARKLRVAVLRTEEFRNGE